MKECISCKEHLKEIDGLIEVCISMRLKMKMMQDDMDSGDCCNGEDDNGFPKVIRNKKFPKPPKQPTYKDLLGVTDYEETK